ncbi:MAG TPA: uracil phosphoribosyltransferase [Bacteroidales bacterium]|nr:uracil phosphoribosyltransferase [Bacteroidales bacterium]HOE04281.1 uracil phosphoribosyltransferase [Bacteroidales bacterium]HQL70217.1 uracil phosphoribosyltransferase [Bacteroidales bacterium]
MKIVNLGGKGTLLDQFLAEIRDEAIQLDRMRFRKNLARTANIFAYEISKALPFNDEEIQTPLGVAIVPTMKEQPVIASVLRAGLPMHEGFLSFFDHADSAFIAGYRKYEKNETFDIQIDYITSPGIEKRFLIICDPMLATGQSMELTYKGMLKHGKPKHTHIAALIASKEGIEHLQKYLPDNEVTIWVAAIDDELTVKSYIVPGLGDAGDLAFGSKE